MSRSRLTRLLEDGASKGRLLSDRRRFVRRLLLAEVLAAPPAVRDETGEESPLDPPSRRG
ncbi:MAG: hypothetical protein AAF533_26950 [Acidobacteriota bacterium]